MKILMLIDQLSVGGAESHVITLTRALIDRGHKVHVFAERGVWTDKAEAAGAVCFFPPAPLTGKGFGITALLTILYLRRLIYRGGYDVLHAHTRRTALLLRLLGRPFCARVVTCHARFAPRYRRISYWGEGTIAVSEDLKAHLADAFGQRGARVRVIPNGIDGKHFSSDRRTGDPNTVRVTFASRLDEDCSAGAWALLSLCKDWRALLLTRGLRLSVTIIGGGSAYSALCREAASINEGMDEELVRMAGAVDDPAPIFRQTDLFVGVSRAAMEALFCGASVLLAGNEGMAGLLTEENLDRLSCGNLCCRGEEALTRQGMDAAFRAFLKQDVADREAQVARLRTMSCARLGAKRMAQDTERFYRRILRLHCPDRWFIAGYAGCGNLGDDAILRRLVAKLTKNDPAATVLATVRDPADPCHRFGAARLIDRRSPAALFRAIRRSDALILGGGCLLQNCSAHGWRSLVYYLALAHLARLLRRPVLWVAAGVGPLRGRLAGILVGYTLRHAAYISVRDAASRRLLISLGIPPARIRCEADPVLSLVPAPKADALSFLEAHLPMSGRGMRYFCIAPRPGCADEQALARALIRLYQTEGIYPLFLPFDCIEDAPVCDRLVAACGVGVRLPCEDEALIASLFSLPCVQGVAAGRLHALILAHVSQKAAVALGGDGRDGKVAGFAASVGFGIVDAKASGKQVFAALRGLFNCGDE